MTHLTTASAPDLSPLHTTKPVSQISTTIPLPSYLPLLVYNLIPRAASRTRNHIGILDNITSHIQPLQVPLLAEQAQNRCQPDSGNPNCPRRMQPVRVCLLDSQQLLRRKHILELRQSDYEHLRWIHARARIGSFLSTTKTW